jgi:hypothetical protein
MTHNYKQDESPQIEGFSMDRELALRSLLFTLVFYLLASPQTSEIFVGFLPPNVDVLVIQALLFSLAFYFVSTYL